MKSWVYFARHGVDGPIKIGRAYDPHKRVRGLSVGSPIGLVLIGAVLSARADEEEAEIHARLDAHCIRGEWFTAGAVQEEMERLMSRLVMPEDIDPQETENDTLGSNLNIRVTADELTAWKVAARSMGMPLSQWARNVFNAGIRADDAEETAR